MSSIVPRASIELTLREVRVLIDWYDIAVVEGESHVDKDTGAHMMVRLRAMERTLLQEVRRKRERAVSADGRIVGCNMRAIRKGIKQDTK